MGVRCGCSVGGARPVRRGAGPVRWCAIGSALGVKSLGLLPIVSLSRLARALSSVANGTSSTYIALAFPVLLLRSSQSGRYGVHTC